MEENDCISTIRASLANQMKAALSTLKYCIDSCPDSDWDSSHGDYPFSQIVFHALFYADFYLGRDCFPFKEQDFHRDNAAIFADYEELEDRAAKNLYSKGFCRKYLVHCLLKIDASLSEETAKSIIGESGISFRKNSRMELYIYNIRHIHHHAAQLGLRVQMMTRKEMPWIGSGWRE